MKKFQAVYGSSPASAQPPTSDTADRSRRRTAILALVILVIGLFQMTGDLFGVPALKGIGAATGFSPAPKVFTAHKGLETYSTKFFVEYVDIDGNKQSIHLTPELYYNVKGPYNRRNIFGAALSYGPVMVMDPLTKPIFDSVSRFAVCGDAPLLREIGIDPSTVASPVSIRFQPAPGADMGEWPRVLEVSCK